MNIQDKSVIKAFANRQARKVEGTNLVSANGTLQYRGVVVARWNRGRVETARNRVEPRVFSVIQGSLRSATVKTADDAGVVAPPAAAPMGPADGMPGAGAAPVAPRGSVSPGLKAAMGTALSEVFDEFGPEIYNGIVKATTAALKTAFTSGVQEIQTTVQTEFGEKGVEQAQRYFRRWLQEITSDVSQYGVADIILAAEHTAATLAADFPEEQAPDAGVADLAAQEPQGQEPAEDLMPVEELPDLEAVEPAAEPAATETPAVPAAPPAGGAPGQPVDLLAQPVAALTPRQIVLKPRVTRR
jgi:hypothetical protein